MSGSGGDDKEGLDGGEDRGEGGATIQESSRLQTPALRERGLIKQMEEEAATMGLGGWFNREDQNRLLESWSGPNSNMSESQDQVRTMVLTTIREQTLPNPVRVPNSIVQNGILILLMEGPIRPYQCLIWVNQGSPPKYLEDLIPSYCWRALHTLVQIGLSHEDLDGEYAGAVEREESVEL